MRALKSVKQNYQPSDEILSLLNDFRCMVNDCIRIGLAENVTSLKSLSLKAYGQLSAYDVPSYYKLCAISKATGILRNHRKSSRKNPNTKTPHARRPMLTTATASRSRMTNSGFLSNPTRTNTCLSILTLRRFSLAETIRFGLSR